MRERVCHSCIPLLTNQPALAQSNVMKEKKEIIFDLKIKRRLAVVEGKDKKNVCK